MGSFGADRLLRHLSARALRGGVLPLLLGPFDQAPPVSRARLAREIARSIQNVRLLLDLPDTGRVPRVSEVARDPDTGPLDLALAVRRDLNDLVEALPADDPLWSRVPGQPRAVLLCHRVDGWLDAADDLLGMLGPGGLRSDVPPLPVVLTGSDVDPLKAWLRTRSSATWFRAAPLDRLSAMQDEDLRAYHWWLLNPPEGKPAYFPKRHAPPGWQQLLRWVMRDRMFDADALFGFAAAAQDYLTSETDLELLASLAEDDA
jgi:hypothetical protein